MSLSRDPLSVLYDDFAGQFLGVAVADPYGTHTATVRSPARDPVDSRGLTQHERAVIRSLYYALNSSGAEGPRGGRWMKNPDWSLQVLGWSEPEYGGGLLGRLFRTGPRRRVLAARVVRAADAHRAAGQKPWSQQYTANPAEQAQALAL
jgi:hypothetical protein